MNTQIIIFKLLNQLRTQNINIIFEMKNFLKPTILEAET